MRPRASHSLLLVLGAASLIIYLTLTSSLPSPLRLLSSFTEARVRASCSPRAYANGSWTPKSPYTVPNHGDMRMHSSDDALAFAGFPDGCASNREFYWHLASDNEQQWDRWPGVTSWQWTPAADCEDLRPWNAAALVKELVETGGWLLIGDSVTENHFFSLSCLLAPHVIATPDYSSGGGFDRAWPQHLFLAPSSPLLPLLTLPAGFDLAKTPLVTFRRVDLLLDKGEIEQLYADKELDRGGKELFSEEQFWSLSPRYYVRDLFLGSLPTAHYSTLVISTGGHWTTTLFAGLADESMPFNGIDNVLDFFEGAMDAWAREVQAELEEYYANQTRLSWRGSREGVEKRVVVRAYLPGHEDCHDEREPWTEVEPFVWNWYNWGSIGEFNNRFESVLDERKYPDIHFLAIDRPARLRPDAHAAGDCLHIMTGAGVLEGWTHYIWHYVSRELTGRIR